MIHRGDGAGDGRRGQKVGAVLGCLPAPSRLRRSQLPRDPRDDCDDRWMDTEADLILNWS